LYSAEVSAAYESRARATATAATAPMAGPRVSMPAPLQAPEMVWASNQAWSRIKQVTSTPLTTETPRWSRTAPATRTRRGWRGFIREEPRDRRCPCLDVCAARNIPGPRFSCSGSVLLRFPGDGRARDALAEHPVAPRLVTQHQRQEGHGDPRHHGECVVGGGGVVHRETESGVGGGRQHVREQGHEQGRGRGEDGQRGQRKGPPLVPLPSSRDPTRQETAGDQDKRQGPQVAVCVLGPQEEHGTQGNSDVGAPQRGL